MKAVILALGLLAIFIGVLVYLRQRRVEPDEPHDAAKRRHPRRRNRPRCTNDATAVLWRRAGPENASRASGAARALRAPGTAGAPRATYRASRICSRAARASTQRDARA